MTISRRCSNYGGGCRIRRQLQRLVASILFIEQPISRAHALDDDVSALSRVKPVIIDESDDGFGVFPRARSLGYSRRLQQMLQGAVQIHLQCGAMRAVECRGGCAPLFHDGRRPDAQAGLALQQDLALVNLIGIGHVERNGHHYVNGMAGLPAPSRRSFWPTHPDLYEHTHGAARLRIRAGRLDIGSLARPGFASGAYPDWKTLRQMRLVAALIKVAAQHQRADLAVGDAALEHPEPAIGMDVFHPAAPSTLSACSIARAIASADSITVCLMSTTPRPKPISGRSSLNTASSSGGRCAFSITM